MMSTDTALWNIVENMPDSLKIELLQYAEYLMTKSSNLQREEKGEEITNKKGLAGSMKGTFVLPLSEDFDEPLEPFIGIIDTKGSDWVENHDQYLGKALLDTHDNE
jgi:hypothetical protein